MKHKAFLKGLAVLSGLSMAPVGAIAFNTPVAMAATTSDVSSTFEMPSLSTNWHSDHVTATVKDSSLGGHYVSSCVPVNTTAYKTEMQYQTQMQTEQISVQHTGTHDVQEEYTYTASVPYTYTVNVDVQHPGYYSTQSVWHPGYSYQQWHDSYTTQEPYSAWHDSYTTQESYQAYHPAYDTTEQQSYRAYHPGYSTTESYRAYHSGYYSSESYRYWVSGYTTYGYARHCSSGYTTWTTVCSHHPWWQWWVTDTCDGVPHYHPGSCSWGAVAQYHPGHWSYGSKSVYHSGYYYTASRSVWHDGYYYTAYKDVTVHHDGYYYTAYRTVDHPGYWYTAYNTVTHPGYYTTGYAPSYTTEEQVWNPAYTTTEAQTVSAYHDVQETGYRTVSVPYTYTTTENVSVPVQVLVPVQVAYTVTTQQCSQQLVANTIEFSPASVSLAETPAVFKQDPKATAQANPKHKFGFDIRDQLKHEQATGGLDLNLNDKYNSWMSSFITNGYQWDTGWNDIGNYIKGNGSDAKGTKDHSGSGYNFSGGTSNFGGGDNGHSSGNSTPTKTPSQGSSDNHSNGNGDNHGNGQGNNHSNSGGNGWGGLGGVTITFDW